MAKAAMILVLIGSSLIATMFYPLYLPDQMVWMLRAVLQNLWSFDGLLPITAIFNSVFLLVQIMLYWFFFKLIMSVLGGGNDIE